MDFIQRSHPFSSLCLALTSLALAATSAGCVGAESTGGEGEENVADASQAIVGGQPADMFTRQRAVWLASRGCTGTIVSPTHILTASHCKSAIGDTVRFYTSADLSAPPPPDPSTGRSVVSVSLPAGVNPLNDDFTDASDKFADIAVLEIDAPIPATSRVADLAWTYPGVDVWGTKVGGGPITAFKTDTGFLREVFDQTDMASDGNGYFFTNEHQVSKGDSGGPFYVASRSVGVLYGYADYGAWQQDKYTSVANHLPLILSQMDYSFSGTILATSYILTGDDLTSLTGRPQSVCAYACERTAQCVAFNHYPNLGGMQNYCQLKKTLTGYTTFANATPGIK